MTTELAALECLKYCFFPLFSRLQLILFKPACNEDIHSILNEFKFQLDKITDWS